MAVTSGLITGLVGFSLKKEMMGDAIFFRETSTFSYEIYSTDFSGIHPQTIQNNIFNEFKAKYSGDINVKVFSQPADYLFPNDSIRVAKFLVDVQVKSVPNIGTWQPDLGTGQSYYKGLDSSFFQNSGKQLLDFKEDFSFETADNGVQTFLHNLSFGLLTGSKPLAIAIASGIYANDKDTTFGISNMVGGISTIADSSLYRNFYAETYDTIRNVYSFQRKRDILSSGASTYVYNLVHVLDVKEDGIMDVTEKGIVKGKLTYLQAQQGADSLISTAYGRANSFYGTYSSLANNFSTAVSLSLVNLPVKVTRVLNRQAIAVDYEVSYTNSPLFISNGSMIEEVIDINELAIGLVSVKHTIDFSINKRTSSTDFSTLISSSIVDSPTKVSGYYTPSLWPIKHIKKEIVWPNRKPKGARVIMEYSNNPKYFVTINGTSFRSLEYKITNTLPVDIVTEYKVINRPTKLSVLNYAYQTEKGQISIAIDAGIGRNPDEFITSFRTDIGNMISVLYTYATQLFFNEFRGTIPLAFTYFLQDVKYTYNSDSGVLQLTVVFTYSLKKYTL